MSPPLFTVGVPPGNAICTTTQLDQAVDGPSVQSDAAQVELAITNPFSFCGTTDYWIISADTGVHPSVAGHAQFAAALQAVADQNGLGPPGP
jgi:hypothetical protein